MNIENLGRQAIDQIRSIYELPKSGFLAGGSIANLVWELASGNKAVINDIDIFIFDGLLEDVPDEDIFCYKENEVLYHESLYSDMSRTRYMKDFYSITESIKEGIFNYIRYKSSTKDKSLIIKSFDINATRIGYSID